MSSDKTRLQATPAKARTANGGSVPATIVAPAWKTEQLVDITRGLTERHWLTPEQADREISHGTNGRYRLYGPDPQPPGRKPEPKPSRGRSR